jgi:hypothetical protein
LLDPRRCERRTVSSVIKLSFDRDAPVSHSFPNCMLSRADSGHWPDRPRGSASHHPSPKPSDDRAAPQTDRAPSGRGLAPPMERATPRSAERERSARQGAGAPPGSDTPRRRGGDGSARAMARRGRTGSAGAMARRRRNGSAEGGFSAGHARSVYENPQDGHGWTELTPETFRPGSWERRVALTITVTVARLAGMAYGANHHASRKVRVASRKRPPGSIQIWQRPRGSIVTPSHGPSLIPSLSHSVTPSLRHSLTPSLRHSVAPSRTARPNPNAKFSPLRE